MESLALLAVAALLALWPASVAARKGRWQLGWWIFGTLLLVVALPAAYLVSDIRPRCRYCKEPIRSSASVCPHCQRELAVVA